MNISIIIIADTLMNSMLTAHSLTDTPKMDDGSITDILLYIALTHPLYVVAAILFPLLAGFLLYLFIRQLPQHISQKAIETYKSEIFEKLEFSKIVRNQVEPKKIDAYIKLANFIGDIITGKIKIDPKKLNDIKRQSYDVGTTLFFFASDRTIQKYIELRKYVDPSNPNQDPNRTVELYTEVIALMRKDLHAETNCTAADFKSCIF